jgi:serine/threonine protein kinase
MTAKTLPEFRTAFGLYKSEAILGNGGSGVVYSARDDQNQPVAVKVLDPSRATRDKLKRFKNEYLFGFRNQHARLLRVLDYGLVKLRSAEAPFYVMPRYADSLRGYLRRGLQPDRALSLFAQIVDGVEAAHLLKAVHRDLKPENILINGPDDLVLADFGVARFEEDELFTAVETRPNDRLANFLYAAPEQRRRGGVVDQRADIFALGLMLNEFFTGEVPHGAGYRLIAESSPKYAWVDEVVAELIQQVPERRPPNISTVRELLSRRSDQFLARQKISALSNSVVPDTAIDDPLALEPPSIVGVDYDRGSLIVTLDRTVNAGWIDALKNMGNYQFIMGAEPHRWGISGKTARVGANEHDAQAILNTFKEWLPAATQRYAQNLEVQKQAELRRKREALQAEREELERRERVRSSLHF